MKSRIAYQRSAIIYITILQALMSLLVVILNTSRGAPQVQYNNVRPKYGCILASVVM